MKIWDNEFEIGCKHSRILSWSSPQFEKLGVGQSGRHFADDIFKRIFLDENFRICICDKPLSEAVRAQITDACRRHLVSMNWEIVHKHI